jgi:molybdate transport system substrate-binding protein
MKKKAFMAVLISILIAFSTVGGTEAQADSEIIVSAAISLTNAFGEIGTLFKEKQKEVRVLFNFGASGDLARQIVGGAPVDVFASASPKDMDDLNQKDLIIKGTRKDFAGNRVVLIIPAKSGIRLTSVNDLSSGEVKRIAIGNPKTVPAGRYSEEVLTYFHLIDAVKDRLIFAENVRQVLDYVARGEVDAGMVYSTDALVRAKEVKIVAEAPRESHAPVIYPIAVVKGSTKETMAREFISVVTSNGGKRVLEKHGFRVFHEGK